MKLKRKSLIIASCVILGLTVSLAVGLSFIPVGDKDIERSAKHKNVSYTKGGDIPGLPVRDNNKPLIPSDDKNIEFNDRAESPNIITETRKVRYVALGDSITAGFDSELTKDYPGSFDFHKQIFDGISYPVYLASFINKISDKKLEYFKNFATSNTTLKDWTLLLSSKEDDQFTAEEVEQLKNKFGANVLSGKVRSQLINELRRSNLITMTLGANDFMEILLQNLGNIPLLDIVAQIKNNNLDYSQIAHVVSDQLLPVFNIFNERLKEFMTVLKARTKTTNINIIGYPLPIPHIFRILESSLAPNSDKEVNSISQIVINLLNERIKNSAFNNKINYMDCYQSSYWNQNLRQLVPNLFEIHPGVFGYKRIAQDIFMKLIIPTRKESVLKEHNIPWDAKYFASDVESFYLQFKLEDPFKTITNIFGDSINKFTFETSNDLIYLRYRKERKEENYINRVLHRKDMFYLAFDKIQNIFFESKFYKSLGVAGEDFKQFLLKPGDNIMDSIKEWLFKSKYFSDSLLETQKEYYKAVGNGKPNFKEFTKALKNAFTNEPRLVKFLVSFFTDTKIFESPYKIVNFKNKFSALTNEWFNVLSQDTQFISKMADAILLSKAKDYTTKNDVEYLLKSVLTAKNKDNKIYLSQMITDIITNIIDNKDEYKNATSFNELWQIFIAKNNTGSTNLNTISNILQGIINSLLKDSKAKLIISNIVSKFTDKYPWLFTGVSKQESSDLINKILNSITDVDSKFNLIQNALKGFVNGVFKLSASKGFNIKNVTKEQFKTVIDEVMTNVKDAFKDVNKDILEIAKILINNDFKENKETISKIATNIFIYLNNREKDNLATLIVNKIYDENKHKDLISKADLITLIQKSLATSEAKNIIPYMIIQFFKIDKSEVQNINKLNDLLKLVFSGFTQSNAYAQLSPLIQRIAIMPETSKIFKDLITNLIKKKAPSFANLISADNVIDLITSSLNDPNFKFILDSFIEKGLFTVDLVFDKNKNTKENLKKIFNDVLKNWLSDKNRTMDIAKWSIDYIKSMLNKNNASKLLANIVVITLEKKQADIFKNVDKNLITSFLEEVINKHQDILPKAEVIQRVLSSILHKVGAYGFEVFNNSAKTEELIGDIFKVIKEEINKAGSEQFQAYFFRVFKTIASMPNINKYTPAIKQLILNVIGKGGDLIVQPLAKAIAKKINNSKKLFNVSNPPQEYITVDQTVKLLKAVFETNSTKKIIDKIIDSLFEISPKEIQSAKNFSTLVVVLLKKVVKDIKTKDFANWITDLLNLKELKIFLGTIRSNTISDNLKVLSTDDWIKTCKDLINIDEVQYFVKEFFNVIVLNPNGDLANITKKEYIFEHFFGDENKNAEYANKLNSLIIKVAKSEPIITLIASLIQSNAPKEIFKQISINDFKQLLKDVFAQYNEQFSKDFQLVEIYKLVFNAFGTANLNNNKVDTDELMNKIFKLLEGKTANIFDLVKKVVARRNDHTVKQLLKNVFNYFITQNKFGDLLANNVYDKHQSKLIKYFATRQEFIDYINTAIKLNKVQTLVNTIIEKAINTLSNHASANTAKKFVDTLMTDWISSNNLKEIYEAVLEALSLPETIQIFKKLVPSFSDISNDEFKALFELILKSEDVQKLANAFLRDTIFDTTKYPDFNNLKPFENVVKDWFTANKEKTTIINYVKNILNLLLKNASFNDVISSFVYKPIHDNYDAILKGITENEFKVLIKSLLPSVPELLDKIDPSSELIKTLLAFFGNVGFKLGNKYPQNNDKLLNSIKSLFSKGGKLEFKIDWILTIIKELINNNELQTNENKQTVTKLIKNILSYRKVIDAISNAIDKNTKVTEYLTGAEFTKIWNQIITKDSFNNVISSLIDTLFISSKDEKLKIRNASHLKPVVGILVHNFSDKKIEHVYSLVSDLISIQEVQNILIKVFKKYLPDANINNTEIETTVQVLAQNDGFKKLLVSILNNGIFGTSSNNPKLNSNTFKELKFINAIVIWAEWTQFNYTRLGNAINNTKNIINALSSNETTRLFISKIICEYIYKTAKDGKPAVLNDVLKNIEKGDLILLTNSLLKSQDKLLDALGLSNKIYEWLFETLSKYDPSKPKSENQFKSLTDKLVTHFKEQFSKNNFAKSLSNVLKAIVETNILKNENTRNTVTKLVLNILALNSVIEKISKVINEKTTNAINNYKNKESLEPIAKALTVDSLNEFFKNIFQDNTNTNKLSRLFNNLLNLIDSNSEIIIQNDNFFTIFKAIVNKTSNKQNIDLLISSVSGFIDVILRQKLAKNVLWNLWKHNVGKYDIKADDAKNKELFESLYEELPSLFEKLKVTTNVFNGLIEALKVSNDSKEFTQKIGKAIVKEFNFKDYSFVKILLNSNTFKNHKNTLKEIILGILRAVTKKENGKANKHFESFIADFDLVKSIEKLGLSEEEAKQFWSELLLSENDNNNYILKIFDFLLTEIFNNSETYTSNEASDWFSVIIKIFNSHNINNLKQIIKEWYKYLTTTPSKIAVFKPIGFILFDSLKKSGYKLPDDKKAQYAKTIYDFIWSFATGIEKSGILDNAINSVFNKIQTTNFRGYSDEQRKEALIKALKDGALSFISNGKGKISISKVFDQMDTIQIIFNDVNPKAFSDFFNMILDYSPVRDDNNGEYFGIYNPMFISNTEMVSLDLTAIVQIFQGKFSKLMSIIFKPLAINYFNELIANKEIAKKELIKSYNDARQLSGYKSIWRFNTFLLSALYINRTNVFWRWPVYSYKLAYKGLQQAFNDILNSKIKGSTETYKEKIETIYGSNKNLLQYVGLNSDYSSDTNYWFGVAQCYSGKTKKPVNYSSASNDLSENTYGSDFVLVYIYYPDTKDVLFNPDKTKREVLIEGMQNGYLPILNIK